MRLVDMNMKRNILLYILLLVCAVTFAGPVSMRQAQQKATEFAAQKGLSRQSAVRLAPRKHAPQQPSQPGIDAYANYYVFNIGSEEGFVIVSGNDETPSILGYADGGSFDEDNMPSNMRQWLKEYDRQLTFLERHPNARAVKKKVTLASIAPLLTCTWNQGSPYNDLCPIYNDKRSVTGCVATAMAQVLYYHRYPASTTATIPGYTTRKLGINVDSIVPTTIDWANMKDSYDGSESTTEKNAVATLMKICGASVMMDYTPNESGAYSEDVVSAAKLFFDYDDATVLANRDDYTAGNWDAIIYQELAANRPVFYSGSSTGGGHAFVIDGYSHDGLFHVNWGWGGSCNNYFLLSILDPQSNSGIGASSSTDGYSFGQAAIIGMQPNTGEIATESFALSTVAMEAEQSVVEKSGDSYLLSYYTSFFNQTGSDHKFNIGIYVEDKSHDGENSFIVDYGQDNIKSGWGYNARSFSYNLTLPDGHYTIYNISRESDNGEWMLNHGYDRYYIDAVIADNKMTLTSPTVNLTGFIDVTGNLEVGGNVEVISWIQNNGPFFNGTLYLRENGEDVGARVYESNAGSSETLTMYYQPESAGSKTLSLVHRYYSFENGLRVVKELVIAEKNITIESAKAYDLAISGVITNADANKVIHSGTAHLHLTVTNNGSNDYLDQLLVYTLNPVDSVKHSWYYKDSYFANIRVFAGETKTVDVDVPDLTNGNYWFIVFYKNEGTYDRDHDYEALYDYTVAIPDRNITLYHADGTSEVVDASDHITVTDEVTAVDLSGFEFTSVTPNINPNTLYIVNPDTELPTGLEYCNIIRNGVCESLELIDGYDFVSPLTFNANAVRYTRVFHTGADGTGGWSTLFVPFDVDYVECEGNHIQWFTSATDSGKNFWVKSFEGDYNNTLYFDYADKIRANKPYIVAVPGNRWGSAWDLTGKYITFVGMPTTFHSSSPFADNGTEYNLMGSTYREEHSNIYMLNDEGITFELNTTLVTKPAFRAYIESNGGSIAPSRQLAIHQWTQVTGINELQPTAGNATAIYNLKGQKVSTPTKGTLYIRDGKKFIEHNTP